MRPVERRKALADALDVLEAEATTVVLDALEPILDKVTAAVLADMPTTAAALDQLTTILDEWGIALDRGVLPYYETIYRAGGLAAVARMAELGITPRVGVGIYGLTGREFEQALAQSAGGTAARRLFDEAASIHLAMSKNRFNVVGEQAWQQARLTMVQGFEAGLGTDEIARQLRKSAGLSRSVAKLVARTEVVSAANAGSLKAMELEGDNGAKYKQWLSTLDSRTRPTHVTADGQVQPRDGLFFVGGRYLQYPGDPAGGPEETWNCRCSILWTDNPEGEVEGVEGRQEGGVLADTAEPPDLFGMPDRSLVDSDLWPAYDQMVAFRRMGRVDLDDRIGVPPQGNQPSIRFLNYETARRDVGAEIDHAIQTRVRRRIGDPLPVWTAQSGMTPKAWNDTMATWTAGYQREMRVVLKQLGVEFGQPEDLFPLGGEGPSKAWRWVRQAAENIPARWIDQMNADPIKGAWEEPFKAASYYDPADQSIHIQPKNGLERAVTHETFHHAESTVDDLRWSQWAYKWERESAPIEGTPGTIGWRKLQEFADFVWYRAGGYPEKYMGRWYDNSTNGPTSSTHYELWTTASEAFLFDPLAEGSGWVAFHGNTMLDLGLRQWVLGVLATL
jgi:SPP1 gp7 family putative phage head morphogenesis protein